MGAAGPSAGDLLGAASLLLAILGALLGIWYPEISSALAITRPDHLEDAGPERKRVHDILVARSLPLFIAAVIVTAVFTPEAIRTLIRFSRRAVDHGLWAAVTNYDAVSISLVVVPAGMGAFTGFVLVITIRLWRLKRKLTLGAQAS